MKTLREIAYKALVDNLNIEPKLLSRIEYNDPISIELANGEEIFVYLNEDALQTFIEIPLRDSRNLRFKAPKLIETLLEDADIFVNFSKEKVVLISEMDKNQPNIEQQLSKKLSLFNKFAMDVRN